jgi:hypothetical protein
VADDVNVQFGATTGGAITGINDVKSAISSMAGPVNSIVGILTGAGEALAGAFAVTSIISFARAMGEAGLQAERTASILGISTSAVGAMSSVAKLSGVSMEEFASGIGRISLAVQRSTKDGFTPQAQALKVLGLNARELIGIPADQYFAKLADAVQKFNPSLNLTNALMAVGGRGIAQMLPTLQLGGEAFKQFQEKVALARGQVVGFVPAAVEVHRELTLLDMSTSSLSKVLFIELKPAIDGIITGLTNFVQWIRDTSKESSALRPVWDLLAGSAKVLATTLVSVLAVFQGLGTAIAALMRLATGEIEEFQNYAKKSVADFEGIGRQYRDALYSIWGTSIEVTKEAQKKNAAAINEGARGQIQAQVALMEAQIGIQQQAFEREKILINQRADLWQTTENQRFGATAAASERTYQIERDTMIKIRALWAGDPIEYAKRTKQIELLEATHATDIARINAQSVKAQQQNWDNVFGAIQTSFNANLRGLLAGTTTFTQAFKSLAGDMVIFFIQEVEKMAAKWVAGQLAQLTATEATEAAKATAAAAGEAATLPIKVTKFVSDITADAALVFAGIFAQLAPILGPGAAAPAAAGQATVLAELANVPKFEMGTDYVPRTGLAIVHQGEKITPANQNVPGAGATGGDMHVHIHGLVNDGASIAKFFRNHSDLVLSILRDRARLVTT